MTELVNTEFNSDLSELNLDDETVYMLTTTDNPFNPFTQYDSWYAYDVSKGYFTSNFLARIVNTSDDLSERNQRLAINLAIEEILKYNVLGIYIKVTKDSFKDRGIELKE